MTDSAAIDAVAATSDELEKRYTQLSSTRDPYLQRAREASLLTIPHLYPEAGTTGSTKFYKPYQSIGARGVNNLANKLLLSLLPPNTPFFKLSADDQTIAEISNEKDRARVEEKFNEIERAVQTRIETGNFRAPFISALKLLVVGGNVLILLTDGESRVRVIRLDNYVVRRDSYGNVMELIIREDTRFDDLPSDVQLLLTEAKTSDDKQDDTKALSIYTVYRMVKGRYQTYQTVRGIEIPKSRGSYPKDKAPFIALRWTHEDNEDYGRSYVEEYIGDLQSAEGLSKSIIESSAAAAKVVIMVASNGLTREEDVSGAENLDVISGRADDVTMLQLNKQADMAVAQAVLNDILQRLSYAFLMNTAVQRNAERVTAEEIREMVKELEDALGGTYALFAQELQLPFVKIIMSQLVKAKRIPDLGALKKMGISVEPTITTGVEAIGRGQDISKLQIFMQQFVAPFGEAGFREINLGDLMKRGGVALGIDMDGLVKSPEEKQAELEAAQAAQDDALMKQTMAGAAEKAAGPMVQAAMAQPQQG
nr:MAG TPA: Head to tail joining protein [Caudoviricetes sp.]